MKSGKKGAGLNRLSNETKKPAAAKGASGFTLLEVLVSLVILAIGATAVLTAISGSLRNVRKVQIRTRVIEYAENVTGVVLSALYPCIIPGTMITMEKRE